MHYINVEVILSINYIVYLHTDIYNVSPILILPVLSTVKLYPKRGDLPYLGSEGQSYTVS